MFILTFFVPVMHFLGELCSITNTHIESKN
jgi:hypothetical protein